MPYNPQNFVDKVGPPLSAVWLNALDTTVNFVLAGAQTVAAAQVALSIPTSSAPLSVAAGGTGAGTQAAAITALGIDTLAVFNIPATNQQFANSGAVIQRFNDRTFFGDAAINDGNYPNITQDWLSAFQTSYNPTTGINGGGPSNGTLLGVQAAVLGNNVAVMGAWLTGAESKNASSTQLDSIVNSSFGINNSTTQLVDLWTYYAEAHRLNDTVGSTIGFELDVVNRGALRQINPYNQNYKVSAAYLAAAGAGYQATVTLSTGTPGLVNWTNHGLAAGAGVMFSATYYGVGAGTLPTGVTSNSQYYVVAPVTANSFAISATQGGSAIAFASGSTGTIAGANQFPVSVAYYIGANPVPFDKGIVFTADSIAGATGTSGYGYAINLASGHVVQWWGYSSGIGVPTGSITSNGTSQALQTGMVFQDASILFQSNEGLDLLQLSGNAGAVNYLNIFNSATGVPVVLQALGSDTEIDIELLPKAGYVRFGTFTANTGITPAGYIVIKTADGTAHQVMCSS